MFLRKIVNHPRLIYNYVMKNQHLEFSDTEEEEEPVVKTKEQLEEEAKIKAA